jgi:hypothetical protein
MERRSEPRITINETVSVTLLRSGAPAFTAVVVNLSGDGLCLAVPQQLANGDPVQVRFQDSLYVGEVVWCQGGRAGIHIDQALHGLRHWRELRQQQYAQ